MLWVLSPPSPCIIVILAIDADTFARALYCVIYHQANFLRDRASVSEKLEELGTTVGYETLPL